MNWEILFYGALIISFVAACDRVKEIIQFFDWFVNSIFARIKNMKWFKWWRSWDEDEIRHVTIFGIKILLHPIFWDGYHNIKNIMFAILVITHCIVMYLWTSAIWYSLIPLIVDPIVIYLMQWGVLKLLVNKKDDS